MFSTGVAGGWNSPTIPKLIADDSPIPMTLEQGSWLITVAVFGMLVTAYPTVWLSHRLGPKHTLLLSAVPFLIGWLLIVTATTVFALFVARIFFGFAYGCVYTLMPVYLSEIASDRVRGSLMTISTIQIKSGFLFVFAVAPFVSVRTMALIAMLPCVLFVITFACWAPDSPYHLLAEGRRIEAQLVLRRLRGRQNVDADMAVIEAALQTAATETMMKKSAGFAELLLQPAQRRALIIGCCTALILPMCGSTAINDYSQIIFAKIDWELSAVYASIVLASVQLCSAVIGSMAVDVVGRRPMLIGSGIAMALCTATVAAYFGAEQRWQLAVHTAGWVPILSLMVFQFAFSVGMEPVAAALTGELYPKHLKSLACAIYILLNACADVTTGKMFQVVSDGWGSDVTFAAFAICSTMYAIFAIFMVPETKGRSLVDIVTEMRK